MAVILILRSDYSIANLWPIPNNVWILADFIYWHVFCLLPEKEELYLKQHQASTPNYRRMRKINIIDERKPDRISKISRHFSNGREGVGNSSNLMCISTVVKGLMEGFLHIIDHIFNFSLLICRSVANKQGVWIQNGSKVLIWNKWQARDNCERL